MPVELDDVCIRSRGRAPGGIEVGAGAPLSVWLDDVCLRCEGRATGGVEVGAGARLPVGYGYLYVRR